MTHPALLSIKDVETHETLVPVLLDERRHRWVGTWRQSLASSLHAEALLENFHRFPPRTAREHSEREWLASSRVPGVLDAAVSARAAHRARFDAARPTPRPRKRRQSSHAYYAIALATLAENEAR